MGGFFAKYYHFNEANGENCDGTVNTSKLTPRRRFVVDPRSPTTEICRTPIQVEVTPKHLDAGKKVSPLTAAEHATTAVTHQRVSVLRLQGEKVCRSPQGTVCTPVQVVTDANEQHVEQVRDILLYEGGSEVPLVCRSPGEVSHPSCARIMGLAPQLTQEDPGAVVADEMKDGQRQLAADMDHFLSGLSKALSLTETQQQKVMRTYHGRENSVPAGKKLRLAVHKTSGDPPPPLRMRAPLSDVNSPHQLWRGRSTKDDPRNLSALSENTPPGALRAVWDQDATVVI